MELYTSADESFNVELNGPEDAVKGLLIVHDWWGILEYNHKWAKRFAKHAYRTMVVDLYEGAHPDNPKSAGEYMRDLDQEKAGRKLSRAIQYLSEENKRLIGALGWSFGGLQVQHAVLRNPELIQAAALFYCRIILNRHNVEGFSAPLLAVFAERERTWPDKQADLELIMTELNKPFECSSYDADHGFANPESVHYDSEACEDSWRQSLRFFEQYLNQAP